MSKIIKNLSKSKYKKTNKTNKTNDENNENNANDNLALNNIKENVNNEIEEEKPKNKLLQYEEILNKLENMQTDIINTKLAFKKFCKLIDLETSKTNKIKSNNIERKPSGFGKISEVPKSLCALLKIDEKNQMTRPDITKKLHKYLDANNLRGNGPNHDKRLLRVNDELAKVFGFTPQQVKNINECTSVMITDKDGKQIPNENGLHFYNIQHHISEIYKRENNTKSEKLEKVDNKEDKLENNKLDELDKEKLDKVNKEEVVIKQKLKKVMK